MVPSITEQQRRANEHAGGPAHILVSAGTGKTSVIERRLQHLLSLGVAPDLLRGVGFGGGWGHLFCLGHHVSEAGTPALEPAPYL